MIDVRVAWYVDMKFIIILRHRQLYWVVILPAFIKIAIEIKSISSSAVISSPTLEHIYKRLVSSVGLARWK